MLTTARDVPVADAPSRSGRFVALDVAKGILVVLMVVYHSINYSSQYYQAFRYMAFLPPTFIIITGYLLGRVYAHRSGTGSSTPRLLERGAKLLLVFILLNVGAQLVRSANYHGQAMGLRHFFVHWPDTFLMGGSRAAAFEVLLPIAYLLLLGPLLLRLRRLHGAAIPLLTLLTFVLAFQLERHASGSANLNFLAAGLLGMSLAWISWERLTAVRVYLLPAILAYAVYAFVAAAIGQTFLLQMAGAVLGLAIVLGTSQLIATSHPGRLLAQVGAYSLLGYIVQIAILQVLSHLFGRPPPISWDLLAFALVTLVLTTGIVIATDWIRRKVHIADRAYRAVFP